MQRKKAKGEIEREGRLRFHTAKEIEIVAHTPKGTFKLFKVVFMKNDGSVYVPFPYLGEKKGLLSEVDPSLESDPKTIDLARRGVVVDYDVKCSFHKSGEVHFSKSGKMDLLPRRKSFPLAAAGRLFEFRAYHLEGFEPIDLNVATAAYRGMLRFPRHPEAILVTANWLRKKDVVDKAQDPTLGPTVTMIRPNDRFSEPGILIGQPRGFPLRDHLLVLTTSEIPTANGADTPTAVFWGGWDFHDGTAPETAKMLAFMYPFDVKTGASGSIALATA